MNVVVSIGGERQAVPVRAIPFLTDLDAGLQPIVLAKIFAEEDHTPPQSRTSTATKRRRLPGLQAFRLESGVARPISVRAWSMYSADLHQMEGMALDLADRDWLIKATSLLPPGAFVWKDEFEESYKRSPMVWNGPEDDLSLDFSPVIPSELQELVMEGFEPTRRDTPGAEAPQGSVPERLSDERLLKCWAALGGTFDKDGNPRAPRGAFTALTALDTRKRSSVTAALKKAHKAAQAALSAFGGVTERLRSGL